jgi:hypothetical protein
VSRLMRLHLLMHSFVNFSKTSLYIFRDCESTVTVTHRMHDGSNGDAKSHHTGQLLLCDCCLLPMNTKTPLERLASLSVQEAFGSTVQLVGDVLQSRGELTLPQIVTFVKESARHNSSSPGSGSFDGEDSEDDDEDDVRDNRGSSNTSATKRRRRLGVVLHGRRRPKPWDRSSVRAALAVLLQHEIVSVRTALTTIAATIKSTTKISAQRQKTPRRRLQQQQQVFQYTFEREPALRLLRHAKYIEFFRRFVLVGDDIVASALQCLLLAGRLRTCDWILAVVSKITVVDPRYTAREQAVEAAHKLESLGFVVRVEPAFRDVKGGDHDDGGGGSTDDEDEEFEFEGPDRPTKKKKRLRIDKAAATAKDNSKIQRSSSAAAVAGGGDEDPIVVAILNGSAHYKNALLPVDRVWRVNFHMFHAYQRAFQLGRLVAERYGHKVQSCGSLITAALKHRAQTQHNPNERPSITAHRGGGGGGGTETEDIDAMLWVRTFSPMEIIKYVPKTVLQIYEKKPGGLHRNLAAAFDDLVNVAECPVVIKPSNAAAAPSSASSSVDPDVPQTRYEVHVGALIRYLQERIIHQVVSDRHDDAAARVVSILWRLGYLEAETIADHAMVPVKEAREVLHWAARRPGPPPRSGRTPAPCTCGGCGSCGSRTKCWTTWPRRT